MNRVWFDTRPPHLRPVVGWWEWHTKWRFTPGKCRECHQPHKQGHKMSCSRRLPEGNLRRAPWYLLAGFGVVLLALDAALVYVLSSTGLPDVVDLVGWLVICLIVVTAFNLLWLRAFFDWLKTR